VLLALDLEQVGLVTGLLHGLLVVVLELDVVLHLTLDHLVLVREGPLQQVNAVLPLVQIAVDP
jgi:hypothetical protein